MQPRDDKKWTLEGLGARQAVDTGEQRSLRKTLGWLVTCLGHFVKMAEGP